MRRKTKKQQKKMEFSKKMLIAVVAVSIFYTTLSYVLAWFDKNTVEGLTIQILQILWGTSEVGLAGYYVQNCVRAYTASKFGIPTENLDTNTQG